MAGKPESSGRARETGARDASPGRGAGARLKVTQTKSTISHIARNRGTIKALGLRGIGSTSVIADNDATRGMVRHVRFLVSVEEIPDEAAATRGRAEDDATASHRSKEDATAGHRPEDDATASHRPEEEEA
jgi:large subunit ribosomal protein L30